MNKRNAQILKTYPMGNSTFSVRDKKTGQHKSGSRPAAARGKHVGNGNYHTARFAR